MENGILLAQLVAVAVLIVAPLGLLGIAAVKWGVNTSGERERVGILEV